MKKILFSGLIAAAAISGALATQGDAKASTKVTRTPGIYYNPAQSCELVDCTGTGQDCRITYPILSTSRTGSPGNYTCDENLEEVTGQFN